MRKLALLSFFLLAWGSALWAKTVVFWQEGFPTVASQPLSRDTLLKALDDREVVFAGIAELKDAATWKDADLFVLPYGSSVPAEAWDSIKSYLRDGGNLLVLGGEALRVPVTGANGKFMQGRPQDTYARELGFRHSYEVPVPTGSQFAWRLGYSFLHAPGIRARRFFATEGRLDGFGYMMDSEGEAVAAPVVLKDHTNIALPPEEMLGSRAVLLDFDPEAGYWESADGLSLIRESAQYARQGATSFWLETLFSTAKPDEPVNVVVHLRNARRERLGLPLSDEVKLELLSGDKVLQSARVPCAGAEVDAEASFHITLPPGFYTIRGVYYEGAGQAREFYQNALWVEDPHLLTSGPVLGVQGDFLTRDGKPFFPVGSNYFSTEENGWDFSGPRNAWIWEHDFAEMEKHGVNFVRTGVWMPNLHFVEPLTDMVTERFARNLEAYLLCARRHNIVVNFTFFAFVPHTGMRGFDQAAAPSRNPYTDPVTLRGEQDYILSIVNRFRNVPGLCWDLINEPSFSNPNRLWKGNTPNNDPTETAAWHKWLQDKYHDAATLAAAWLVTPEELGSIDQVPLPTIEDISAQRYGDANQIRAIDYNHFAQDTFAGWAHTMVSAIRSTGSSQLINVGQDEGGVTDRVLNQFYATSGVSFTTNHTYWRDDGLLWDSVAAKTAGIPNIVGETGYQPVWNPDGTWRLDEFTGAPLLERKWALGFAAGNSGILTWDWDREVDFGILRSDGSAKMWQGMLSGVAQFAAKAAAYATNLVPPQVAIVLPQSLQLSVFNAMALDAQKASVRALYQYARGEAYAVGEYQTERLGDPKLIILPSPLALDSTAWQEILTKVRNGSVLLVTGPFDRDAHFHPAGRREGIALPYEDALLTIRECELRWPEGEARLTFGGDRTTFLDRAVLPGNATWAEQAFGKGKILLAAYPLELNDNLEAIGSVYRYAMKVAGVTPTYSSAVDDPGILICPTQFRHATLYVLTSESTGHEVSFRDLKSNKKFSAHLEPGHAALLLVGEDGTILSSYNWLSQ